MTRCTASLGRKGRCRNRAVVKCKSGRVYSRGIKYVWLNRCSKHILGNSEETIKI